MTFPSQAKSILIGKETTKGTSVTPDKDVGLVVTDVATPKTREVIESQGISSREVITINEGILTPSVEFNGDIQHTRLFEAIFGQVAHAETTGDWTHTFTVVNNAPSYTIETNNILDTTTREETNGCLFETGELSIVLNENLKLATTFKGINYTCDNTANTPVASDLGTFPHEFVTVTINGVDATEVQEASITFDGIVEQSGGIGSNTPQQSHSVSLKFNFTAKLGFTDDTYHQAFKTGKPVSFKINANNGVVLGSGRQEVEVSLVDGTFSDDTETTSVGGLTFIDVSGTALFDSAFGVDQITDVNF